MIKLSVRWFKITNKYRHKLSPYQICKITFVFSLNFIASINGVVV